jgi:hypothetical protein
METRSDDPVLPAFLATADRVVERYSRGVVLHRAIRGEEDGDVIRALVFWQRLACELAEDNARLAGAAGRT